MNEYKDYCGCFEIKLLKNSFELTRLIENLFPDMIVKTLVAAEVEIDSVKSNPIEVVV